MTEVEWSEESEEAPRKKGGIPKWVWIGCGGGCLFFVLIIVVLGIFIGKFVSDAIDPEKAWAGIHEILPHDERPEGWTAGGTVIPFTNTATYVLQGENGTQIMVMRMSSMRELNAMFEPDSTENKGLFGVGKIKEAQEGTIELQGRDARYLRFLSWIPEAAEDEGISGATIRIDITGKGSIPSFVQIIVPTAPEGVEDQTVHEFLAPFDVWRGK